MREVTIHDVFACAIPSDRRPLDPEVTAYMTDLAHQVTRDQYFDRDIVLRFEPIEWLITNDADEADAFQPVHDCPTCQAGADQMRAFLNELPDRWIALGNLTYVEVWPL